jgi:hypothetical protein
MKSGVQGRQAAESDNATVEAKVLLKTQIEPATTVEGAPQFSDPGGLAAGIQTCLAVAQCARLKCWEGSLRTRGYSSCVRPGRLAEARTWPP